MRLTYHGQSAFELVDDDVRLLIDPWITDNPHTDRAVESFDDVTAALVSHGAYDHLGDAPAIVERTGAELVCDYATHTVLSKRGFPADRLTGLIYGQRLNRGGWSVKAVFAQHLSMFAEEGVLGPPLGFVVSIGDHRVYHMGDTAIFGDIELYGRLHKPTVALVPVGEAEGSLPDMYPEESALAVEWLDPDVAIPMHYPPGSDRPSEFLGHCSDRGVDESTALRPLEPGTTIEL